MKWWNCSSLVSMCRACNVLLMNRYVPDRVSPGMADFGLRLVDAGQDGLERLIFNNRLNRTDRACGDLIFGGFHHISISDKWKLEAIQVVGRHTLRAKRLKLSHSDDRSHAKLDRGRGGSFDRRDVDDDHDRREFVAVGVSICCAVVLVFLDGVVGGTGFPDHHGLLHRKGGGDEGLQWRKADTGEGGEGRRVVFEARMAVHDGPHQGRW